MVQKNPGLLFPDKSFSQSWRDGGPRRDSSMVMQSGESPNGGSEMGKTNPTVGACLATGHRIFAIGIEGVFKRYPEIGDHPKKVLSNPLKGSIER